MENNVMLDNGTQSLSIEPTYGGELMPIDSVNNGQQPSNLEMAASVAVVGGASILAWELGKLFWRKVLVPGYCKGIEWIDSKNAEKDERIARKKAEKAEREARKNKNKNDNLQPVVEEEYVEMNDEPEEEETQEQSLPKKGSKAVDGMRKNRKH